MKGQTYLLFSIIFIIIISVFAVMNIAEVKVNYLFWSGTSPLIFVILFSVLLGGILTMLVGSKKFIQLKRTNKALQEKILVLEKEQQRQETTQLELEQNKNKDE